MDTERLLVFGLAAFAAGGVFYALVYPYLSGQARAEARQKSIAGSERRARATDRTIFARGALAAAAWLVGKPPGAYSLDDMLAA